MIILKNCKKIITQNDKREILENYNIVIEKNLIKSISKDIENQKFTDNDTIIDCSQKIVMPGLINMHTHLPMTFLKGYSDDKELKEWLEKDIWPKEATMTKNDIKQSSLLALKELLLTGTTTFVDMYYHLDAMLEAIKEIPLRSYLGYGVIDGTINYDIETNKTNWIDFNKTQKELNGVNESIKMYEEIKMTNLPVKILITPHSPYTVNESTLKKLKNIANKNNLKYLIHVNETRTEFYNVKKQYNKSPIEFLNDLKVLDSNSILVHNVWATKMELDILKKTNSHLVFCATSNAKLASGSVFPYRESKKRNINITLGTDGSSSNNCLDMFQEMKFSSLLIKNHLWDPTVANAQEILDCATINAANALGEKIGSLKEDYIADLITLDANDVTLQPDTNNIISHLVYSLNSYSTQDVIVNGEILLNNRKIIKKYV
ncbi:MAG: amidohydrolase [Candidatus Nanoarchaeia archaeon]|nr:amidohydrolase [Candidatus Nanoarchaeia archaeon]